MNQEIESRPRDLGEDRPFHFVRGLDMPWGDERDGGTGIERIMSRDEAFEILLCAHGKTPADWLSWMHLGTALHIAGDSEGGLNAARKALEMYPCAQTMMNVAVILECFGRFDEAMELSEKAIPLDPTDQFAGLLWAQGILRRGQWKDGWHPFEQYCWGKIWEYGLAEYIKQWNGESLSGKRLLVIQGGGFGDNMMFMRWFRELKEMGAHITYACPDILVPLLVNHPWIDRLLPTHEGPETDELPEVDLTVNEYDYFVPIMGIPRRLRATVESLRWDGPYITADPEKGKLRKMCLDRSVYPKVGVCWMGAEKLDPRRHRSLNLEQTKRLLSVGGIDWVSLQFGMTSPVPILNPQIKDWSDTAAIIDTLDLVVTVDTGVMHLAGAMGKPTLAMIPSLSDWKFLLDRDDMVFYPSVRLFRNGRGRTGLDHALDLVITELSDRR